MIPYQLQLKNFLSYGPELQIIDFSRYNLICLSGKNGHGKSALLEAITWAIWGQARKSSGNSKADAGLMHLGQNHMMVILEFEVNRQMYRVRREFLQTKTKAFATLDFGIKATDGKITPLTDKTIKDTQDKIDTSIGITYEAFTNSTFLRQGQSNEFSKKSPKERKEILAQILQLQKFEDQKRIALIHAKKLHQDFVTKSSIAQRVEKELQELVTLSSDYKNTTLKLDHLELQQKENSQNLISLFEKKQLLIAKFNEAKQLKSQQDLLKSNLLNTKSEIEKIARPWHEAQKRAQTIDRKSLEQKRIATQSALQSQQEAFEKKLHLKEQYLATKELSATLQANIEKKYGLLEQNMLTIITQQEEALKHVARQKSTLNSNHKRTVDETSQLNAKLITLKNEVELLKSHQLQHKATEEAFEKNKMLYQSLCAQGTYLKQHLEMLTTDKSSGTTTDNACCPLCEQKLTPTIYDALQTKLSLQQELAHNSLLSTKAQALTVKKDLQHQQNEVASFKTEQDSYITLSARLIEYNMQLEKLETTCAQILSELNVTIKEEEELLKAIAQSQVNINAIKASWNEALNSPELIAVKTTLNKIETDAKILPYDQATYKILEQELSSLQKLLTQSETETNSVIFQETTKAKLFELFKRATSISNQLSTANDQLLEFGLLDNEKQIIIATEQELNESKLILDKMQQDLLVEKGSLEQKQKKQYALDIEQQSLTKHIKIVQQEMIDYQEIAKALGKDGIQALLIEQAIPEIEHETNQILSRLTNNQTQIFIESLRDLKKGGNRETLDIKISDQFGLRDYELFSGGEAFRIDFALRIGISKLLARRAGTTLQTIFIDEGFGSQDEEGLQLIMDNIYKIQDEFAKIIVVSHLQEMKEQFPVQFIVEKKRSGSIVSIVEQG